MKYWLIAGFLSPRNFLFDRETLKFKLQGLPNRVARVFPPLVFASSGMRVCPCLRLVFVPMINLTDRIYVQRTYTP
jgi:hypothetical protein